jgi:hypothetical protein
VNLPGRAITLVPDSGSRACIMFAKSPPTKKNYTLFKLKSSRQNVWVVLEIFQSLQDVRVSGTVTPVSFLGRGLPILIVFLVAAADDAEQPRGLCATLE